MNRIASVLNTMYDANSLGAGATCGITEETKGTFRSGNEATKLENALKGAWKVPEYWKTSHIYIANLKRAVTEIIDEAFDKSDRISIAQIYDVLKAEPYGFMPCNLTAFILGFILKEYLKLLFPNVQSEIDVDKTEFRDYCLIPAMKMRRIIKLQQGFIDTEYKGKDVPFFTVDD